MTYVDGFVIPIPKKNVKTYAVQARWGKRLWMKHGALAYYECVGEDLKSMPGCSDFKKLAKLKPTETVVFSFIVFKSKAHRNAVNKKVMGAMNEAKNSPMPMDLKAMPFDVSKMVYGGFKTIVQG